MSTLLFKLERSYTYLAFIGHIYNLSATYEQGRYKGQASVIINIIYAETKGITALSLAVYSHLKEEEIL